MNNIQIEVNGVRYTGWESVTVTKSIETFCGGFSFTGTFTHGNDFPIKVNDTCTIFVNEISMINGFVEKLDVTEDANTHRLSISGRDKTCDLADNTLGGKSKFTPPLTLKQIVEKVLQIYDITNIKIIDPYNLSPITENIDFALGQTAEEFLQECASKRNVLITTDNNGDLIFQRSGLKQYNTVLSKLKKDYQIIKRTQVTFDNTKRFHEYIISDQGNSVSSSFRKDMSSPQQKSHIGEIATDPEIRKTRRYYFSSDDTSQISDSQTRVKWEANFRRAQSLIYICDIVGFKPPLDDGIWNPNKLIRINDPASNINTTLLISSITFQKDNNQGSITKLKCISQDSFTLEITKPRKQQVDDDQFGQVFVKSLKKVTGEIT